MELGRHSWLNCVTDNLLRLVGYSSVAASSCSWRHLSFRNEDSPWSSTVHISLWFFTTSILLTQAEILRSWAEKGFQEHFNLPALSSRSDCCWVFILLDSPGKQFSIFQSDAREKVLWHFTMLCTGFCWFGTFWSWCATFPGGLDYIFFFIFTYFSVGPLPF